MAANVDIGSLLEAMPERIEVELGSLGKVPLASLSGEEGLSQLFRYEGEARAPMLAIAGKLSPERFVADLVTLKIRDAWGSERTIRGIVTEAEVVPFDVGHARVRFVMQPFMHQLTLGRDSRTFHDLDVLQIVERVLRGAGLAARFEVRGAHTPRAYTAQYRESDFDFVSRLLEEEGLYYWFDHAEDSSIVISDHSPTAPDLDGAGWTLSAPTGALLGYQPELGLEAARPFVRELGAHPRAVARKFSLGSFDFTKPSFRVQAAAGSKGIEVYDAPGANVEDPAELARRAKYRRERAEAEAAFDEGTTPVVRFAPGRAFELYGHPFGRFDGRYLIVRTSFRVDNVGGLGEAGKPIDVSYTALPIDLPFRPAVVTPVPKHPGLHSGIVVGPAGEEVYPDAMGRVRLMQHWDRTGTGDEHAGRWVRVAQRGTGASMLLPRMGWNVFSMGEEGSVDLPMVLSRTFDGDHPPPYKLPDNKTRVAYRTATTPGGDTFNEIRYEDAKGGEEMFINATRDMDILVKDTKGEVVHGTMLHVVGQDHSLEVGGTFDVHIDVDQKVLVKGNQTEKVTGDRQKLVDGNENIRVAGSRKLKTGVNAETNTGMRSLRVGAAHISAVLGAVQSQSMLVNQLVGGAVIKATPRKMTEDVGSTVTAETVVGFLPEKAGAAFGKLKALPGVSKALGKLKTKAGLSVQTIGGLKYETSSARKIEVKQAYKETIIAGLDFVTETLTDTATSKFEFDFGNLEAKAKNITIASTEKVVVSCGSTKITVTKSQVKVEASEIQLSKASLLEVTASGKVRINS